MDLRLFLDLDRLGGHIRRCRREKGLTAEQLAEASAISADYLRMIEGGTREPSLSCFVRLSRALGVPLSDLLPPKA